jgi:hypothetical protein
LTESKVSGKDKVSRNPGTCKPAKKFYVRKTEKRDQEPVPILVVTCWVEKEAVP